MDEVDTRHHLEQFSGEMTDRPDPRRGHVDFAWISLCIIDQLGNRLGWERWIHQHGLGLPSDARNWRDITVEIEIELWVECAVDCVCHADQKEVMPLNMRDAEDIERSVTAF